MGLSIVEYPQVLLEREVEELVRQAHGNDVRAFQAHLAQIGQTPAEFRETFREPAEQRLCRSLVLSEITEVEGIEVSDEEVSEQIDTMLEPLGENAEGMRTMFESENGSASIRSSLLTDKTLARLQEIAAADSDSSEPAADEPETEASDSEEEAE